MNGLTLRVLSYVVAVSETGNFSRAARQCHVSQPTLSGQIKKLESYLGIPVFERLSHSVRLTRAGKDLVPLARKMLDAAATICKRAREHDEPLSGAFHLGVIPTLGPYLIPRFVPGIQKCYPRLQLVIREDLTQNLLRSLHEYELDAILVAMPVGSSDDLTILPLFEEPFWLLCPPQHPLAKCRKITEKNLKETPLLLLAEGHCLREQALAVCQKRLEPDAARADFQASSLETLKQMVMTGFGCTLFPALALDSNQASRERFVARRIDLTGAKRRVALMWRESQLEVKEMELLGGFIQHSLPAEEISTL